MMQSDNLTKLKVIYEYLCSHFHMSSFEEWAGRVVLFWPGVTGGVAFVQDIHDPSLIWIQAVGTGAGIFKHSILRLCMMCGQMGFKVVALEALNPRVGRYFGKLGFQKIGDNIYSVRVEECQTSPQSLPPSIHLQSPCLSQG